MVAKISVILCAILTLVVVVTAARIEHLNGLSGGALPLADRELQNGKWEIPELNRSLEYLDGLIAMRRSYEYQAAHPDEELKAPEDLVGPPYSEAEQRKIDAHRTQHATLTDLRWWVTGMGLLQYILAPLAFVWALLSIFLYRNVGLRVLSGICVGLSGASIFFMFLRDYSNTWNA